MKYDHLKPIISACILDKENNKLNLPSKDTLVIAAKDLKLLKELLYSWGGKSRNYRFTFPDATWLQYIERMKMTGEVINPRVKYNLYETPEALADMLVEYAEPSDMSTPLVILEPSAGGGRLLRAIYKKLEYYEDTESQVCFYEIQPELAKMRQAESARSRYLGEDFLQSAHKNRFGRIYANPPFKNGIDVDHVNLMYDSLTDGGVLVSVMSTGWIFNIGTKFDHFRRRFFPNTEASYLRQTFNTGRELSDLFDHSDEDGSESHATLVPLPENSFKESGTNFPSCLIILNKTIGDTPKFKPFMTEQTVYTNEKSLESSENLTLHPSQIVASPFQPRTQFSGISDLASDIHEKGLIHRPVVREIQAATTSSKAKYELVVGERRLRAMTLLFENGDLPGIYVEQKTLTDNQAQALCLTENLWREDLSPWDEAQYFDKIVNEQKRSVKEAADMSGMGMTFVRKRMQLLTLVEKAQELLKSETISLSHAIEICRLDAKDQAKVLKWLIKDDYEFGENIKLAKPLKSLKKFITDEIMLSLNNVYFPIKDANLLSDVDACTTCPFNTACSTTLFAEITTKTGRCTKSACFNRKKKAHAKATFTKVVNDSGWQGKTLPVTMSDENSTVVKGTECAYRWGGMKSMFEFHRIENGSERMRECDSKVLCVVVDGEQKNLRADKLGSYFVICAKAGEECACSSVADATNASRNPWDIKKKYRPDYEEKENAHKWRYQDIHDYRSFTKNTEAEVCVAQGQKLYERQTQPTAKMSALDVYLIGLETGSYYTDSHETMMRKLGIFEEIEAHIKAEDERIQAEGSDKRLDSVSRKAIRRNACMTRIKSLTDIERLTLLKQLAYRNYENIDDEQELQDALDQLAADDETALKAIKSDLTKVRKNTRRNRAKEAKAKAALAAAAHERQLNDMLSNPLDRVQQIVALFEADDLSAETLEKTFDNDAYKFRTIAGKLLDKEFGYNDESQAYAELSAQFPLIITKFKKAGGKADKPIFMRLYEYLNYADTQFKKVKKLEANALKVVYKKHETELDILITLLDMYFPFMENPSSWDFDRKIQAVIDCKEAIEENIEDEDDE